MKANDFKQVADALHKYANDRACSLEIRLDNFGNNSVMNRLSYMVYVAEVPGKGYINKTFPTFKAAKAYVEGLS